MGTHAANGAGSLRERRPGVWEIRVTAGVDVLTGRPLQRSLSFRGTERQAQAYRRRLAADYAERRAACRTGPLLSVAELLEVLAGGPAPLATLHPGRLPLERPGAARRHDARARPGGRPVPAAHA